MHLGELLDNFLLLSLYVDQVIGEVDVYINIFSNFKGCQSGDSRGALMLKASLENGKNITLL